MNWASLCESMPDMVRIDAGHALSAGARFGQNFAPFVPCMVKVCLIVL